MMRSRNRAHPRRLRAEQLESRLLLANDLPFQNPAQRFDVNRDLRVSALDGLQIINFIGRNGFDFQLPASNGGVNFPDVNGSGHVSSLDALQVINRLFPQLPPIIAARLVNDSAPGGQQNLDFLTNQYSLEFGVSRGDGSEQLEIRIDGIGDDPFTTIPDAIGEDPLLLTEAALDDIAPGPLADGDHQFEIRVAGQTATEEFVLTVDRTAPLPQIVGGPTVRVASDELRVNFGEPITVNVLPATAFSISESGSGNEVGILATVGSLDGSIVVRLAEKLSEETFDLTVTADVSDVAGNALSTDLVSFTVADPAGVTEFRPNLGETMVRTTAQDTCQSGRTDRSVDGQLRQLFRACRQPNGGRSSGCRLGR